MKKPILALLLAFAIHGGVKADELIENGDFSQGNSSWHGDTQIGQSSLSNTGLVVVLDKTRWVKVYQEFVGKGDKLTVTVSYQLSPDAAFSDDKKEYKNVSHKIGYDAWKPFHIKEGTWCMMMSDFGPDKGHYYTITPKFGTTEAQGFSANPPGKDQERKTLTFAFPPGTGTVTLLKVSVQN